MNLSPSAPILVAVDFSDGADQAFEWAVDLAATLGAPLHVLHVAHDPEDEPGRYASSAGDEFLSIEEVARKQLAEYLEAHRITTPRLAEVTDFESDVVVGLPVTRILEVSLRDDVQLIVLGGTGRTALADALLGSKVERVAQRSEIPVAIVKTRRGSARSEEAE